MNQTFHFVKVAAGEPFPDFLKEDCYTTFRRPEINSVSSSLLLQPGKVAYYDEDIYILQPAVPASPDVEGFIESVYQFFKLWVKDSQQAGMTPHEFMRQHFPAAPSAVTREAAEAWARRNAPVYETAMSMYDYLTTSQPQPVKEAEDHSL